jgi:hypothetical protein
MNDPVSRDRREAENLAPGPEGLDLALFTIPVLCSVATYHISSFLLRTL